MKRIPNYDKTPTVSVPGADVVDRGWMNIAARLRAATARVIAIEAYVGVHADQIRQSLGEAFGGAVWIPAAEALLAPAQIESLVAPFLGGNDPIFGHLTDLTLRHFFDSDRVAILRARIEQERRTVIVYGVGASIIAPADAVLVYADLPRWEAQQRQRRHEVSNLGVANRTVAASLQYKRSFFVDWRVCDRLKQDTLTRWDFVLDTTDMATPKLVSGAALRRGLAHCVSRPFRVVPFFDPGPWGGQWMKEVCDLDRAQHNFAWCFDCVPEENSLLLDFSGVRFEIPALDLVLAQPRSLLGEPVEGRFGAEFPIRFDFLDTMGGGNLSLQVHPRTQYIREHFGVPYTQDESYYILDAQPEAFVYLGRSNDADVEEMFAALEAAQRGERAFDAERYVGKFPARRHDHFLIPAGTLHCSGRESMVLEISATPYIFTFKLWDWGRMGLDGLPRPINLARGRANVCWERNEDYARRRLVNRIQPLAQGSGWREERTGLHEAQFIETRRHWFTGTAPHDTGGAQAGSVNVLNLVQGDEAIVESPHGAFEPFVVHYAETFIVPAGVGRYNIRPHGRGLNTECATIKASVRCQP